MRPATPSRGQKLFDKITCECENKTINLRTIMKFNKMKSIMKTAIVTCFIWCIFTPLVFSQNGGGRFLKRSEYNFSQNGYYNLSSKGDIEKLFFGKVNAQVEFFFNPSFKGASGFRIMRDSLDKSYILEVKYISNYKEASDKASAMYPAIASNPFQVAKDSIDTIAAYNRNAFAKQYEEMNKLYKVETLSFSVSDWFAEKLYEKMVSLIDNFKAKGVPPIMTDGYSVTFRTVVEDEVWALSIHMPQGSALKMADICRQIIEDAKSNKLNESEYNRLIDKWL